MVIHRLLCIATVGVYYVGYFNPYLKNNAVYLFGELNKIPAIICAVLIFWGFKNWNAKHNRFINRIAACTFGVYLFYDNPNIRELLWVKVLGNARYITEQYFAVRLGISIITVFLLGILIELIRQNILLKLSRIKIRK